MLLCNIASPVLAGTVHSWVDDDGVTHFSDSPPAVAVEGATTLVLNDLPPSADEASSDYYSIVNQWQRMSAEREKKTATSLARARIRADQAAALSYDDAPYQGISEPRYFPAYGFPYRNGGRRNLGYYPEPDTRPGTNRGPHHVQAHHGKLSNSPDRSGRARSRGSRQNPNFARGNGLNFNFDFR
jgi:hypothetical protein